MKLYLTSSAAFSEFPAYSRFCTTRYRVESQQVYLRLTPCYWVRLQPTYREISGAPSFLELTGGEYKAREHIHRRVADRRLLAIPVSWSRIADSNPD